MTVIYLQCAINKKFPEWVTTNHSDNVMYTGIYCIQIISQNWLCVCVCVYIDLH